VKIFWRQARIEELERELAECEAREEKAVATKARHYKKWQTCKAALVEADKEAHRSAAHHVGTMNELTAVKNDNAQLREVLEDREKRIAELRKNLAELREDAIESIRQIMNERDELLKEKA
jgi:chromosome segregation ATPase